jgi:hypothetical protein
MSVEMSEPGRLCDIVGFGATVARLFEASSYK